MQRSYGTRRAIRLGRSGIFWLVLLVIPLFLNSSYTQRILLTGVIYGIFVLGVNLKVGWAGLFSAGEAAWFGIGAYTSALLTVDAGWNPWLGLTAAAIMGLLSGYIIGAPLLRLKTHYLAFATLGANLIVVMVLSNWVGVTHGAGGVIGIPTPGIGPFDFDTYTRYTYLAIVVLAITMWCCWRLNQGRMGRSWRAVRDSETAAGIMGVNVGAAKRRAFAIAGLISAVAGGLYAHSVRFVSPEQFGPQLSILVLVMAVVGGLGRLYGPIVAAIGLTALPEALRATDQWYLFIYGVGIYALVILLPVDGAPSPVLRAFSLRLRSWRRPPAKQHAYDVPDVAASADTPFPVQGSDFTGTAP